MRSPTTGIRISSAWLAAVLMWASAPALAAYSAGPPAQTSGAVRYVTGGVGLDESEAMLRERQHYPLALEIYAREGGHDVYTADAAVTIRNAQGDALLETHARGPFLLADVPPGRYAIEVTRGGHTEHQTAVVGKGSTRRVFVFGAQ